MKLIKKILLRHKFSHQEPLKTNFPNFVRMQYILLRPGVRGSPRREALEFLPNTWSWGHQPRITPWLIGLIIINHKRRLVRPFLAGCHYSACYSFQWIDTINEGPCPRCVLALSYLTMCSRVELPSMHQLKCKANWWSITSWPTPCTDYAGPLEENALRTGYIYQCKQFIPKRARKRFNAENTYSKGKQGWVRWGKRRAVIYKRGHRAELNRYKTYTILFTLTQQAPSETLPRKIRKQER